MVSLGRSQEHQIVGPSSADAFTLPGHAGTAAGNRGGSPAERQLWADDGSGLGMVVVSDVMVS